MAHLLCCGTGRQAVQTVAAALLPVERFVKSPLKPKRGNAGRKPGRLTMRTASLNNAQ